MVVDGQASPADSGSAETATVVQLLRPTHSFALKQSGSYGGMSLGCTLNQSISPPAGCLV